LAWRKRNITRKIRIQVNRESSKEFAADGMRKGPGCKNGIRRWDVMESPQLTTGRKAATSIGGRNERAATTGRFRKMYRDLVEDFRTRFHEANSQDVQWIAAN
jgi:hypothetical protein